MPSRWNAMMIGAFCVGCANTAVVTSPTNTAAPSTVETSTIVASSTSTSAPQATTTTSPAPLRYVFPFAGRKVSYGRRHHDYPATDVFGCAADIVAPVAGEVDETRETDPWMPKVNDPATRGGKYVSMIGIDGVRYYFAHLDSVAVRPGERVGAGDDLGVMGQTGNARRSACHTHFGISWPCQTANGQSDVVGSGRGSTSTRGIGRAAVACRRGDHGARREPGSLR